MPDLKEGCLRAGFWVFQLGVWWSPVAAGFFFQRLAPQNLGEYRTLL